MGQSDNLVDGDQVALRSGGSGKGALYYTGQKWQFYANGLYQLPLGIDLSGTAWGRQGGLKPIFLNIAAGGDGTIRVAANPTVDAERYGNVWDFDLRLAKTFRFGKQAYFTLAGEWFNVAELRPDPDPDPPGQRRGLQPDRRGPEPEHLPPRRDLRLLDVMSGPGLVRR